MAAKSHSIRRTLTLPTREFINVRHFRKSLSYQSGRVTLDTFTQTGHQPYPDVAGIPLTRPQRSEQGPRKLHSPMQENYRSKEAIG